MTSQTGKQIIAIHIVPDISRSKGNKPMKVGQLVECKNSYTNCGREPTLRPFYEKSKLSIYVDQQF